MHTLLRSFGSSCFGLLLLVLLLLPTNQAFAATFTVTTTNGSGPGSLLAMVAQANSTPGQHTIEFSVSGSLIPVMPLPLITNHLTFTVRGSNAVVLDGQAVQSILTVAPRATVILHRLQLINGRANGNGGAINNAGLLFLNSCVFSNNLATGQGGALFNSGQLTAFDTVFLGNEAAQGGALYNGGTGDFTRCVLSNNRAGTGGAIQNTGSLSVTESTLAQNLATQGWGGGIFNAGQLVGNASTLSDNVATGASGYDGAPGRFSMRSNGSPLTIGGGGGGGGGSSGLGGGLYTEMGSVSFTNSTIFGNRALGGQGGRGGSGDMPNQGPVFIGGDGGQGGGREGGSGGKGYSPGSSQKPGSDGGFASGGGGGGGAGSVINDGQKGGALGGGAGFGGGNGGRGGSLLDKGLADGFFGIGGNGGDGAEGLGGGCFIRSGTVSLVNCTITSNAVAGGAGGEAGLTLREATAVASSGRTGPGRAGGLFNHLATVVLQNTLIADNGSTSLHPDLEGVFASAGYNLIGNNQGASGLNLNDFQNVPARLSPLQDNGGPTWTCALLPGSPAIGAGTSLGAPDHDQRGAVRPVNHVDMGAFQVITRITPTLIWNHPADLMVGTPLSETQLNASCSVPGTFDYDPPLGTMLAAGQNQKLTVVFTPLDRINFTSVTNSVFLNIIKRNQTLTFDPLPDRPQDDPPRLLSASASSGLPVALSVLSGPAVMVGNLLSLNGTTGLVTIRATQSGDDFYNPAPSVERSFQVLSPAGVVITRHPIGQTVTDGERVVLEVEAEGPALQYQWQFQDRNLLGETGPTLTLNAVHQAQAGAYRVIVSNQGGSETSQSAILTVRPKISIARTAGQLSLTWGFGVLQSSTDLVHWTAVSNAQSPYRIPVAEPARFYRIAVR